MIMLSPVAASRGRSEKCKGNVAGNGKIYTPGRRKGSRSDGFGPGPGEGLRAGQSPSGLGSGNAHFNLRRKILRVLCG